MYIMLWQILKDDLQSILCYFAYSESHLSHLTWNRGLSICDSPFDVLYRIFSVAIYFFSHIDLSLCHILSKILWLKQDACGMEIPPPLLFSAYIFIFNKNFLITRSPPLNVSISIHKYYYGDSSLYRSALHPYHPKTWTIEILKVVHVSCCFHKLVRTL